MDREPADFRVAAKAAAHVTRMAVLVVAGAWGGSWLDEWFDTTPFLLLLGLLVGTAGGLVSLIVGMKEQSEQDEPPDPDAA